MARTAAEIEADLTKLRDSGVHHSSREVRVLREELKALTPGIPPVVPVTVSVSAPSVAPTAAKASEDVSFINEALAQLVLKGKGAKPEQCYSDIRSVLSVKHILEDASGLVPSQRVILPHWDTLGRDRDSGEKFKVGENQAIVDGYAQRAIPPSKAAASARPVITASDGTPLRLNRSRTIDEPEGAASFVGQGVDGEE